MNLRRLEYLLAVAEEGHFTRAAERLGVTQPALSQQIQLLESEFGEVLLERTRRGVTLTPAGGVVARHARRVLQELGAARTELDELAGLRRGTLSVAVLQSVSLHLVPRVLARFGPRYPGVALSVREVKADELEADVAAGLYELGVTVLSEPNGDTEAEPLFRERYGVVVPEGHPLARRKTLKAADLDGVDMVMASPASIRLWNQHCRPAGASPNIRAELSLDSVLETARRMGVATFVGALSTLDPHPGLVALPLVLPRVERTIAAVRRRQVYRSAASRAFVDTLLEVLSELNNPRIRLLPRAGGIPQSAGG